MQQLHYIPTHTERQRIIKQVASLKHQTNQKAVKQSGKVDTQKKLSKKELDQMIKRLTAVTKREHQIEENADNILKDNENLRRKRQEGEKVENRLIEFGKKTQQKKEMLGVELEKERWQKQHRDVPQISEKGKKVKQKGIDKRLEQLVEQRISKRQELEKKHRPKFTPSVDPYSEFINELDNYEDLFSRMREKENQAAERHQEMIKKMQLRQRQIFTYRPQLNTKSKEIVQSMPRRPLSEYKPEAKQSTVISQDGQDYPFAPQINSNTEALLKNKQNYDQNCFTRLYNLAKQQVHKKQLNSRINKDSFKPKLNSRSLRIVSQTPKQDKSRVSVNSFQDCQEIKIGSRNTGCTKVEQSRGQWELNWKKRCMSMLTGKGKSAALIL